AHGCLGQRDLTIDDDLRSALQGGDDDVYALCGLIERGRVAHVACDHARSAGDEVLERTLLAGVAGRRVADEEAYVDGRLVEKVAGNPPAEHAGSAGYKHRRHD